MPAQVKTEADQPPVSGRTSGSDQPQATIPSKIESPILEGSKGEAPDVESATTETSEVEAPKEDVSSNVPSEGARLAETSGVTPTPAEPPVKEEKESLPALAKATVSKVEPEQRYSVQVASLVVERNALSLKKRLEKLGYQAIIKKTTAPITRYRVYTGEASSREEAERTAERLGADGLSPHLVEMGQGKFALEVGWFFNQNDAIDLAHRLQQKNYPTRIVSETTPTSVYVVRVGAYEDRSKAIQAVQALKEKGFAPVVVRR